jgi:hypothetical protein
LKSSPKSLPLIIAAFAFLHAATAQQRLDPAAMPLNPQAYRVGETLTYDISFSQFVSAAHVELSVAGRGTFFGREGIQLRARAQTTGVVGAAIFALNNNYITYVDSESGLPFRVQQVTREAGRTSNSSADYNQPAGTAAIPSKDRTDAVAGTYDLLSAIYRVRSLPLAEGASYSLTVRQEGEDYQAQVKVVGRELVKTQMGSFNAIVVRLDAKTSSLGSDRTRIYFTDDERHVPVVITIKHPAGEIRAELAGSEITAPAVPVTQPSPKPAKTPSTAEPTTLSLNFPFKVGEQLNYQVYLAGGEQPVGTASFEVHARSKYFKRDGLLLSAKAQTTATVGRLFNANDQIDSYVDPTTLLPFSTGLTLAEGQRRLSRTYTMDQDRGNAVPDSGRRVDIPIGTHDLVSLVYAIRTFDLTPLKKNAISILVNNRAMTLFVTSEKRETIELGGQKISAFLLTLTTDDPQSDKFQFRSWVSDDSRRLPLRFTAVTELGPVRADLVIVPVTQR